jgi:hypothetical protein
MAKMTNVSDIDLKVKISMGPGSRPMITEVAPGETATFPDGYCETVKGPGPDRLPCILSRCNTHLGVPALVPAAEAEEARARYERVKAGQANSGNPQAEIRRLEAELAAQKLENAKAAKPAKAEPLPPAPDPADELVEATTPKPKRKRKAKA